MEKDQRPRFNQETGERITYEDEINQAAVQAIAPVQAVTPVAPVQQATPVQQAPMQQAPMQQAPMQQAPMQQAPPGQPAAKQKSGCGGCLKGCLITLIIFVVIVGVLIGGGYAFYKMSQPKDVKFDKKDVESFYDKVGIDNEDYLPSVEEILAGKAFPSGELKINDSFTSAEVTAVIQDASDKDDYFQDVNVRFIGKDQVEVFATVSENIDNIYEIAPDLETYDFVIDRLKGQQLYYVGDVSYDEENGFNLSVDELKVGLFKIPADMINEYSETVESLLNSTVVNMGGFGIESMKISEDNLDFVGSIPEKLKIGE